MSSPPGALPTSPSTATISYSVFVEGKPENGGNGPYDALGSDGEPSSMPASVNVAGRASLETRAGGASSVVAVTRRTAYGAPPGVVEGIHSSMYQNSESGLEARSAS